uniref:Nephrocystin-4 n=1 Tax=Phallusia mammillata TaxID=59560 RepID=A0A6F9DLW2_9ASCI|nr:nephrocystin-4 [Phallusia mammillata]
MIVHKRKSQNFGAIFKNGKLEGKSWSDIVSQWKDVELSRDRVDNPVSSAYQINLQAVTGLLQLNVLDVYNATYQARISMFDVLYHRFVGTTWCSKEVSIGNQQSTVTFNQTAYFHTPIVDSNMIFAIEFFVNQTPKDPLPGDNVAVTKQRSLGWTVLRPFTVGSQLKSSAESDQAPKKLDVFKGSPRALLYMEDPIESNPNLKPVPGCQLTFTLSRHQELSTALNLLPENSLVSAEQRVPGLSETAIKTPQGKDFYIKPKPLIPHIGYIDKLSVDLGVTVDKFEEELCIKVNQDRLKRDSITDDGKKVTVTERRLMVGVHNGFCYVQKPQYVHLEPEAVVGHGRTQSFGRGKRKDVSIISTSPSSRLVLRSRLQLNEMIPDPRVAIVMQLEYVLAVPPNDQRLIKGSMSSLRAQPFTVMLRWAAWSPYEKQMASDVVTVKLNGGCKPNPDSLLFFKNLTNSENEVVNGTIRLSYLTTDQPPSPISVTSFVEDAVSMLSPSAKKPPTGASPKPQPRATKKIDDSFEGYSLEVRHLDTSGELLPVHAPPIRPVAQSAPGLTRASYARLYSAGFPDILDKNGEPAVVVDTSDVMFKPNLDSEVSDPLQANEIVLQFLAFTNPVAAANESSSLPIHSMFFSFQFYRFPSVTTQRLALLRKENGQSRDPCVLRKIESGEQLDEGKPGLEVKYHVDPAHLKIGENASFLRYIATHNLHIDVWDGESLLLLGSLSVPLKHLLRGGQPAVAANHETDVIFSEHCETTPTLTGDLTTGGSVRPLGLSKLFRGKLHVRFGNVGFPSESKTAAMTLLKKSHLVVADMTGCGFPGGSLSSVQTGKQKNGYTPVRVRAKRMAESNQELSELLLVSATKEKNADVDASDKENIAQLSPDVRADRKRKIARMVAVRTMEQSNDSSVTKQTTGQRALVHAQEHNMKLRDLRTVAEYRDRLKEDNIMEILLLSITTRHILRPTLGVAEFVEFQLKNPFSKQQTVTIECDSDELRVITDAREWRYFKSLVGIHTPVEENMFNFDPNSTLPQIFLRPKETVFIPLCYQGYQADHKVATQNPGQQFKPTATSLQPTKTPSSCGTIRSKVVKAVLRTLEGRPLSVLQLSIDPQPHVVDQTFRFYNPEHTFLKKCIRLPPFRSNSTTQDEQFHVICSDPEVVCQTRSLGRDEPREIFIKAPCGESPSIRRFYVSVYNDSFLAVPVQIWQFYVHALQRVDVNCVLGQTSRFSLVLRGMQTGRLVRCFSSHPQELQVFPDEAFLLPPNSVHEINAGVRTTSATSGSRYMYVNVVDTEYHQLLRSWLVAVKTREPVITKEFDIELPRSGGKGCNKMITYTNPYPNRSEFFLMTSRGDLLQFRESQLELGPGEQSTIGLRFASGVKHPGKFPIYIFINDREDKNEETFLVNVTYV